MRSDASLWLEPTAEEKQEHPRLKYGARLDYKKLPTERLCSEVTEDGYRNRIYISGCQAALWPGGLHGSGGDLDSIYGHSRAAPDLERAA